MFDIKCSDSLYCLLEGGLDLLQIQRNITAKAYKELVQIKFIKRFIA